MQLAEAFDQQARFGLLMEGAIGLDPDTGWHLVKSDGRRRLGRPHAYALRPPRDSDWASRWPRFTASSDAEALQKARVRLAKVLSE